MKTRQTLILILMLVIAGVLATACAPAATQAPASEAPVTEAPTTEVPSEASTCPTATSDTKLLTNTEEGYCLLYPAEAVSNMPGWVVINPVSGPGDIPGDAWVYVQVQDAAGKTAAQFVDEQVTALGEGFNISTSEVEVDGEQAVVVDGLPGQDSNRQVFIVHNGRLYNLVFAPWFPNAAEPTPLEHLYATVMDTFHFLPQE
jgi:hypothetical protein